MKCVELVKENNVVYLDARTTTYEIARVICNIPGILVATNDFEIAQFVKNSDAELIVCGGVGTSSINDKYQVLTPSIEKAF